MTDRASSTPSTTTSQIFPSQHARTSSLNPSQSQSSNPTQAYHSIFLQDQDVRVIGNPPPNNNNSPPPQPANPAPTRQLRPPPSPYPHPWSRLHAPRPHPRNIRPGHRPRQRIVRPARRSALAVSREYVFPEFRDQGAGGPVADLWDFICERVFGED